MTAHALEAAPDPLLGKILQDRYRVVRKLGEGGMGAVYEGEHLVIKKRVAIKVLHPQFATSPEIVARFHQEALAATAIGHEHIVEVNDMGRTPEGAIFMVLEYLSGTDFAGLLEKEGRLTIGRVVRIVMQVCEGVQAAHDKGIVHRDLKPENVFLVKRGTDPDFAKVLDFGISKFQDGESSGARAATKTGSVLGTAYYMSPEQAQGKRGVDHRTDVWAIGVMLFKALTDRYPFDDEAYPMLVLKICMESPPPIRSLRPDVPEALGRAIDRCMIREVDRRVQSCNELRALLAPFAGLDAAPPSQPAVAHAATMPSTPETPAPLRPAPSVASEDPPLARATLAASGLRSSGSTTPRWMMIAGLALIATVLAGGGIWWSRAPDVATVPVEEPTARTSPPPEPVQDPEPEPVREHLEFILSPSEAVVLIDGRPLTPAEDGTLTRVVDPDDVTLHELRVEARGFRSRVEDIRLSYHQRIVVGLDPGTGVDDRRGTAPAEPPQEATGHHPRTPVTTTSGTTGRVDHPSAHGTVTGGGHEESSGVRHTTTVEPEPTEPEPAHTEPTRTEAPTATPTAEGVVAPPPRAPLKRLSIP